MLGGPCARVSERRIEATVRAHTAHRAGTSSTGLGPARGAAGRRASGTATPLATNLPVSRSTAPLGTSLATHLPAPHSTTHHHTAPLGTSLPLSLHSITVHTCITLHYIALHYSLPGEARLLVAQDGVLRLYNGFAVKVHAHSSSCSGVVTAHSCCTRRALVVAVVRSRRIHVACSGGEIVAAPCLTARV